MRGLTYECLVFDIPVCWFTKAGLVFHWNPHGSSSALIAINKFHMIMKKTHLCILRAMQYLVHILAHITLTLFMLRYSSGHGQSSFASLQGSDAAVNSCHWWNTVIMVLVYVLFVISYKITEFYGYLIHYNEIEGYQPSGHCLYVHFSHLLVHGLTSNHFLLRNKIFPYFIFPRETCLFHLCEE